SPAPTPPPASVPAQAVSPSAPGPFYGGDDPWAELRLMQDRTNRIMEECFGRMAAQPPLPWEMPAREHSPDIAVTETDAALVVAGDLPGMEKDKIEVRLKGGDLCIRGSREAMKEEKDLPGWYVRERSSGSFERVISIGTGVKEEAITAE